ncbi:hypothetical protein ON010_g10194 [Phytophthora cinnamomi]|nr:hypothetical protein ON010_g10194 [Phytophthora cinnamomi]
MWYNGHKFDFKRDYKGTKYCGCANYEATKCLAKLIKYPTEHKKAKRAKLLATASAAAATPDQRSKTRSDDTDRSRHDTSSGSEYDDVDSPSDASASDDVNKMGTSQRKTGIFILFRGEHTCTAVVTARARDGTHEMTELIPKKAVEDLVATATAVWEWARQEMITRYGRGSGLNLIKKRVGRDLAYRTRDDATGGDAFRAIEMPPHRNLSAVDHRPLLQFNVSYTHGRDLHRLIGFAHPGLLHVLNNPGLQLFIDGTFSVAPRPFKHVVIAMVYDQGHEIVVPVFYILAQAKNDWTY